MEGKTIVFRLKTACGEGDYHLVFNDVTEGGYVIVNRKFDYFQFGKGLEDEVTHLDSVEFWRERLVEKDQIGEPDHEESSTVGIEIPYTVLGQCEDIERECLNKLIKDQIKNQIRNNNEVININIKFEYFDLGDGNPIKRISFHSY